MLADALRHVHPHLLTHPSDLDGSVLELEPLYALSEVRGVTLELQHIADSDLAGLHLYDRRVHAVEVVKHLPHACGSECGGDRGSGSGNRR